MTNARYQVLETGTTKRPYEVHDMQGCYGKPGWVVFASANRDAAAKRANEMNQEAA